MKDAEYFPGDADYERALAQGEFEFAKARFIRTLSTRNVEHIIEIADRERRRLNEEIAKLQMVARARYDEAVEAKRSYGEMLPHRVGKTWLQPPAALERVGKAADVVRLYKRAVRAAKEYQKSQEVLAKRYDALNTLETQLRERLDQQKEAVERELSIPGALDIARKRDPLLDRAYSKMKGIVGDEEMERFVSEGEIDELPERFDYAGDGSPEYSQFPDEPL